LYYNLLILLIIILTGLSLFKQNIVFSIEYIIFVFLVIISNYLLASSTSLFLTIFLLEYIALLVFGKMAVSRITVKKSSRTPATIVKTNQHSYGLFNALFFQF